MMQHFVDRDGIFFDFDGVLVDSLSVKTRSFARLYEEDAPHIVDMVVAYHLENGGVSRYKKFDHYERVLLGRAPCEKRMAELGERFAALVVEEVVASPEIAGATSLLTQLMSIRKPCYIVSGTPEVELRQIVARRGMTSFFRGVRGSPAEKAQILAELVHAGCHRPERCLMLGDATGDYHAAQAVGMDFLGVVKAGEDSPFPAGIPVVAEFVTHMNPESVG